MLVITFNVVVAVVPSMVVDALPKAKEQPSVKAADKTDKTLIHIAEWSFLVIAKQISPMVSAIEIMNSSTGTNGV